MDQSIEQFKKYLKDIKKFSQDDFKKSNHNDEYFSLNKLKEILIKDIKPSAGKIKEFGSYEYVLFSEIKQIIKNMTDVRDYLLADLHIIFGFVEKFETNGLSILKLIDKSIEYKGQYQFTYTLSQFLQKNFPTMTITIEDNFLKRLDEDIIINNSKGIRVDIVINEAKIVIEYDESQHGKYDHIEKDELRDNVIRAYGYQVIRYKENLTNLIEFFKNLNQTIKDQELIENPKLLGKYIIEFFTTQGYRQDIIEKLTGEIVCDIINKTPYDLIGKTPRSISLNKDIFDWLFIDSKSDKKKIKEILANNIDQPYEQISIENSLDYILSPDAFEELLMYINSEDHDAVIPIRKAYIGIKKKLLQYVYEQTEKLKDLMDTRIKLLKYVSNEAYNRGKKDSFFKYKELEKKNKALKEENIILQNIIDDSLEKNKRGFIKMPIEEPEDQLELNKPVVGEVPQLIYTGCADDYVDEMEIKILFEQNKKKLRIGTSYSKCLEDIKKKLNSNSNNVLVPTLIFYCKIVYGSKEQDSNKPKTKGKIIDKDLQDDEEM